jgi:hypothetical protein
VTPVTVYDTGPLGEVPCPVCKQVIYLAWDGDMNRVSLDADPAGTVAVSLDGNCLPWCRDARGTQLTFDEELYRLHDPQCPGLATVTPIGNARSRRRAVAPRRNASARRVANAR